ncbi:MAG: hypothetical protein MUE87_01910 [Methanothrix sp.]|nr:hypothetical protein [Methanothrix sp.]
MIWQSEHLPALARLILALDFPQPDSGQLQEGASHPEDGVGQECPEGLQDTHAVPGAKATGCCASGELLGDE